MESGNLRSSFLALVRIGIGHSLSEHVTNLDLSALKALAEKQGLLAIVLDGVEKVRHKRTDGRIDTLQEKILLAQWIGEVSQWYEQRYERYSHAIADLATFYNSHGIKMMVLKGYACSLDWPKPNHRPCGDIDIWQFGRQKEADALLKKRKNTDIDNNRQHHTIFYWQDFMVENHYDFLDVHHHRSNKGLEKIFKEMGQDDTHFVQMFGEKVFLPSPNMHALFLLKHMLSHFAAEGITIRHLLDWGFFIKAHSQTIDWLWLEKVIERYGMKPAYEIFNAICVENLGFDSNIFPHIMFNSLIKEKVLNEILFPCFSRKMPKCIIERILYKIRRWKANEWKHKLCYEESMWSAFWSGVWCHFLKPSSI